MKTVLITGASSGFGFETAKYFLSQGWKVIATMRKPVDGLLPESKYLRVLPLDVTDLSSIESLVQSVGAIDVLVNNAGIGAIGALEGMAENTVHELFATNALGTIITTKAFLPGFRKQKSGVIVNLSSSVTLAPLPLLSVYTASKAAVNAFTESLALELKAFNIRVNLVLPGQAPDTQFRANAQPRMANAFPEPYSEFAKNIFNKMQQKSDVTHSRDVLEAIWQAANNSNSPMKIIAGADAKKMAADN